MFLFLCGALDFWPLNETFFATPVPCARPAMEPPERGEGDQNPSCGRPNLCDFAGTMKSIQNHFSAVMASVVGRLGALGVATGFWRKICFVGHLVAVRKFEERRFVLRKLGTASAFLSLRRFLFTVARCSLHRLGCGLKAV